MIAKDIMIEKVISVRKDTPVKEVIQVLLGNKISGVPVLDEEDRLIGIVSEGDLIYKEESLMPVSNYPDREKFAEQQSKALASTAEMAMTRDVITVDEDTALEQVASLMLEHQIKRVPVVRGEKVVGIISRADIMKAIAKSLNKEETE